MPAKRLTFPFEEIGLADLPSVGGKNASLGEMEQQLGPQGVRLAPGFAVSARVYSDYLANNDLECAPSAPMGQIYLVTADWQSLSVQRGMPRFRTGSAVLPPIWKTCV